MRASSPTMLIQASAHLMASQEEGRSTAGRYRALQSALLPWSSLWGVSVLEAPEVRGRGIPEAWFSWAATAPEREQYHALGEGSSASSIPDLLAAEFRNWGELTRLPRGRAPHIERQSESFCGMTPKKRHEVQRIVDFFRSRLTASAGINWDARGGGRILDVGGGAGYLAEGLAGELGRPIDSVDQDGRLQTEGQRRIQRRVKRGFEGSVRFIEGEFPDAVQGDPTIRAEAWAWSVGLHTCGPLAWKHLLTAALVGPRVLNLACCYDRLDPTRDTGLSSAAREAPLPWTKEALFLATRGGWARTLEDFCFQQRVLRYRFTLHALLEDAGLQGEALTSVGSAHDSAYQGNFADYVRNRSQARRELHAAVGSFSDSALEAFGKDRAKEVEARRFATLLRNALARPVELALLLDRAAAIEERGGLQVTIFELFDASISPRNIALVVEPA